PQDPILEELARQIAELAVQSAVPVSELVFYRQRPDSPIITVSRREPAGSEPITALVPFRSGPLVGGSNGFHPVTSPSRPHLGSVVVLPGQGGIQLSGETLASGN